MAFKFDRQWYSFLHNMRNPEHGQILNQEMDRFAQNVVDQLQQIVSSHDVNVTDSYAEGFRWEEDTTSAGFGTRLERSIYNVAEDDGKEYPYFIAHGTQPSPNATKPPRKLVTWYMDRLGLSLKEAYPAALKTLRTGTQTSSRSVMRGLPPSGQKGYDPLLELEESGMLEFLSQRFTDRVGARLIEFLRSY